MFGLNFTMWLYDTPTVFLMEIQYVIFREARFVSEGYTAAKEEFMRLQKEPLAKFLAWTKIKRT
jgi:hypothetical protein